MTFADLRHRLEYCPNEYQVPPARIIQEIGDLSNKREDVPEVYRHMAEEASAYSDHYEKKISDQVARTLGDARSKLQELDREHREAEAEIRERARAGHLTEAGVQSQLSEKAAEIVDGLLEEEDRLLSRHSAAPADVRHQADDATPRLFQTLSALESPEAKANYILEEAARAWQSSPHAGRGVLQVARPVVQELWNSADLDANVEGHPLKDVKMAVDGSYATPNTLGAEVARRRAAQIRDEIFDEIQALGEDQATADMRRRLAGTTADDGDPEGGGDDS